MIKKTKLTTLHSLLNKTTNTWVEAEQIKNSTTVDIDLLLLRKRIIFFNSEVNEKSVKDLISKLLFLESKSKKDIFLYLNSPGGQIFSGLSVIDVLSALKCDINIIVMGIAASFGAIIACCGTKGKRFITENSFIMLHQALTTISQPTKFLDLLNTTNLIGKLENKLELILSQKTGQSLEKINSDLKKGDIYFSAEESIKYGLVDKIL